VNINAYLHDYETSLRHHPSEAAQRNLESVRASLFCRTNVTHVSNRSTTDEWDALESLGEQEYLYTPWLCWLAHGKARPGNHEGAIFGGYTVLLLMTKLNAKPLEYSVFCGASIEERNEIGKTFKKAFTYVSDCKD
jgi:hypothetical protein